MRRLIVDANILALLVVGNQAKTLVSKHKRTRKYTSEDHDLLEYFLSDYDELVLMPNTVTETSNLLRHGLEEHVTAFARHLEKIVVAHTEQVVASCDAVKEHGYTWLGVTDAAILNLLRVSPRLALLTDDLDLYLAASKGGGDAHNFTHLREQAGIL